MPGEKKGKTPVPPGPRTPFVGYTPWFRWYMHRYIAGQIRPHYPPPPAREEEEEERRVPPEILSRVAEILSRFKYDSDLDVYVDYETGDAIPKYVYEALKELFDHVQRG